jgi:phage terminase large subunit-like protein
MSSLATRLDLSAADRAVNFFEEYLKHSKGEWAGDSFKLLPWQRDRIIRPLFGRIREDGTRQYRRAYIEIPRKNGKSTLAAGIALYLLFADGEEGAEIYSAAADREQAGIVFEQAKSMVEDSPALMKRAKVYRRSIIVPATRGLYRVLSADAFTKHGLNAHGILFDELHTQPNRELYDVLNTSTGSRAQPLMVMLTTAGFDRESVCWEQHEYARQVLNGTIPDDSFFAYIDAAEDGDDWQDEAVWERVNPSYGFTIKRDYLQEQAQQAKHTPAYQNTFRRLHLNQWTSQESRWLDMGEWDACEAGFSHGELEGLRCYGGLDLASKSDIAAFVLVFVIDGRYFWLPRFYIPGDNMMDRVRKDRVPYDAWVRDGHMLATPGNVIDFDFIVEDIKRLGQRYNIQEIAFDRWGATLVSQRLTDAGFLMVEFGQGFASMAGPTRELLRLVMARLLVHDGHPVLRWMADNVVVQQDAAGNMKPSKLKSRQKIDGIVAGLMALARAMAHQEAGVSVYQSRGLRVL